MSDSAFLFLGPWERTSAWETDSIDGYRCWLLSDNHFLQSFLCAQYSPNQSRKAGKLYEKAIFTSSIYTLGQKSTFYPKIHTLKIPIFTKFTFLKSHFFTKFTFLKSHFSQNSHFQSLIFYKIHIFQPSISGKKSWFLPQCEL